MSNLDNIQEFTYGSLAQIEHQYMYLFVTRQQMDRLADGILEVLGIEVAVDSFSEWLRIKRQKNLDEGRAFIVVCQKDELLLSGFKELKVVNRDPENWLEKIDDGFYELRIDKSVHLNIIGFMRVNQIKLESKTDEDRIWQKLKL